MNDRRLSQTELKKLHARLGGEEADRHGWSPEHECLLCLTWALESLGVTVSRRKLDRLVEIIIQCMTDENRFFHSPPHIFSVADGGDPLEVLAALYHDVVYVQVDEGINVNVSGFIAPFVKEVRGRLQVRDEEEIPVDQDFDLVSRIFDVQPGQHLALEQNEFLSALVAVKQLSGLLTWPQLAAMAACIEATIPFRPPSPLGLKPSEQLHQRLHDLNPVYKFNWNDGEIVEMVQRAVRVANRDVENFAEERAADFLNNTWKLLPETNPFLRSASPYTVSQYRHALEKMTSFMNFLEPILVFRQFQGEPATADYELILQRAGKNISVARLYLSVKLVAIAILEGLSLRLGNDVPLTSLVGRGSPNEVDLSEWQTRLPEIEPRYYPQTAIEAETLELLSVGRTQTSEFDIRNSPLATFLVLALGFEEVVKLVEMAKAFFQGKLTADQFLDRCDEKILKDVTTAILKEFESRTSALLDPPFSR